MRFIGVGSMIIAVVSMIFGFFPNNENIPFMLGVNVATTLAFGLGSIWSFWWSMEQSRIENMLDGFLKKGAGRTYAVVVFLIIGGILFSFELMGGSLAMGLLGVLMLISSVFYIWRAQQISKYQ